MFWLQISSPASAINWQAVRKVATSELVCGTSLALAEIGVLSPENVNVYPDVESIRIIWGEEMVLGVMVGILKMYEEAVKKQGPKDVATLMKKWVIETSCCPMKWHGRGAESSVLLAGAPSE